MTNMKSVLAITAALALGVAALAYAQTAISSGTRPLAEVAKEEEARRKSVRTPAKVYTNSDLRADYLRIVPPPPSVGGTGGANGTPGNATSGNATPGNATPSNATPSAPVNAAAKPEAKDQAYWAGRMKDARSQLSRSQIFADSLQSRINALTTEYVNRDDPAQRSKIESDKNLALAELERVKKEIETQTKAIQAIEDDARRAGVPAGWLRQ
jgi:HAMP domain-containing protein